MKKKKGLISQVTLVCLGALLATASANAQQCPQTPTLKIDEHTLDFSENKPICVRKNGTFKNGEGSMSKWKASETAVRVTEEAIQILGGYGYTREYPVERWHRDAKIHTIFEGTSEIQQIVIARAISGLRIE